MRSIFAANCCFRFFSLFFFLFPNHCCLGLVNRSCSGHLLAFFLSVKLPTSNNQTKTCLPLSASWRFDFFLASSSSRHTLATNDRYPVTAKAAGQAPSSILNYEPGILHLKPHPRHLVFLRFVAHTDRHSHLISSHLHVFRGETFLPQPRNRLCALLLTFFSVPLVRYCGLCVVFVQRVSVVCDSLASFTFVAG